MTTSTPTYEELLDMVAERDVLIEELRSAKEYINAAKEYYLKIFEDFPALIWRARLDKKCDYFNHTWLKFTGRTFDQEFGDGWAEGVHPEDLGACFDTYVNSFDRREPFVMEYRLKNKEGEYRWIRDFGRPFYDLENNFAGYIGSCYDITDYKNYQTTLIENAETLQRAVATKDRLFSIIAHDLKAPLGNILLLADLLLKNNKTLSPDKLISFVENIYSSALRTENLLSNLLDWSRSQLNSICVSNQKTSTHNILNDVQTMVLDQALPKNIKISYPGENFDIITDPNLLKIILRNLLSNAIKFSYPGSEINVNCKCLHNELIFSITDHGVGIEKHRLDQLFKIATNKSTLGTQRENGTGLGLIVCKEFTDLLQGTLTVESGPEKGCTFYLHIPLKSI
jgi:two-component system CheB/CheR fusion protein